MTQPPPGSIPRDLTHVRVGAGAERLYLYPSDVTENFLNKSQMTPGCEALVRGQEQKSKQTKEIVHNAGKVQQEQV